MKKINRGFVSFFSIVATAAINYTIIHNSFVFIVLCVLIAHELGHFFSAKKYKGNPKFPIFVPLPFVAIAITKVSKMTDEGILATSFYGPFVGFVTSIILLLLNFLFNFIPTVPLMVLATTEVIFNYFGSDGSKYRKAKRRMLACT